MKTNSPIITVYKDKETLYREALASVLGLAQDSVKDHGYFSFVLAGGSTPIDLYANIAGLSQGKTVDFHAWRFFFGDERLVPSDHEQSNYHMVYGSLFEKLLNKKLILPAQIYRVPTELENPRSVTEAYTHTIYKSFGIDNNHIPSFDLLLLGLGSDGHIASLFPGKDALTSLDIVTDSEPGILPPLVHRITLTLPAINAAKNIFFLAMGEGKASAVKAALTEHYSSGAYPVPASLVNRAKSRWFIDTSAAAYIS
jgi:6-phosphogluconolactonase